MWSSNRYNGYAGRRFAREPEVVRVQRLAMLAELSGKIERGDFTRRELLESEAALRVSPSSPQHALPFPGKDAHGARYK